MRVPKIDIHIHPVPYKLPIIEIDGKPFPNWDCATPEELRALYNQHGIAKAVILPIIASDNQFRPLTNEDSAALAEKYPDLFYWFCNIDPRGIGNTPDANFTPYLKYYRARGARGVGELTCNLYMDDPYVLNLFRHCEACDMPVTIHIGNRGNDYGVIDELGLPRLEKVLAMFPNLIILGHSQKFWAEISGDCTEAVRNGYPKGKVVPGGRLIELMRRYPNLHCDLSAGSGCNAITRDPEFGYAFLEEFQDRLYYGTDICNPYNVGMLYLADFLDEAVDKSRISEAAYRKICCENALRILNKD